MKRSFHSRFYSNSVQAKNNHSNLRSSCRNISPRQLLELIQIRRSRLRSNCEIGYPTAKSYKQPEQSLPHISPYINQQYHLNNFSTFQMEQSPIDRHKKTDLKNYQINSIEKNIVNKNQFHKNSIKNPNQSEQFQQKLYQNPVHPVHSRRHKTIQVQRIKKIQSQQNQNQILLKGINKIRHIMMKKYFNAKDKNNSFILPLVDYLSDSNQFFKNLPKMMTYGIIKKSKIRFFEANTWIYKRQDLLNSFFIILCGKLKVFNTQKQWRKVSVEGETISQHIIFMEWNANRCRQQGAKAILDCFLLEIDLDTYLKMNRDLILQGYKSDFLNFQNMIKKNYLEKKKQKQFQ